MKKVVLKSVQPTPHVGIYNEVDKNPLAFDITTVNVELQASSMQNFNFMFQERQSFI